MIRLENWKIYKGRDHYHLEGNIYNHPNPLNYDGRYVTTSPILYLDFQNKIAKTNNNEYELGKMDLE